MPIPTRNVEYDFSDPACYPGSGSTFYDLAGSTNGSTNSTTFVSDGDASYFTTNGSSTFLSTSSYTPTSNTVFSYNLWFQLNNTSYGTMFQMGGDGSVANTPAINANDPSANRLNCSFGNLVSQNQPSQTIPVNTWKCITVVCDGSTNKVYYDGLLVNSVSQSTGIFGVGPIQFGRFLNFQYASVKIALFQLFNTALNATEVGDIYATYVDRFNPPIHEYDAADPASYPGSGSTLFDIGSAPINLTINNATFNNVNDSFTLQGTLSSYVRSAEPISIGIGTNNFSYQMWFQYNGQSNLTGPVDPQLQVGSRGPGNYGGCTLTTVSGQLAIESPGIGQLFTGFSPVAGKWYLITVTVNSSNLNTLYVNGVSTYTGTQAYTSSGTINSIALGPAVTNLGDASFSGFGPVQIYNRVITTTEITNYYDSTRSRFRVIVEYDFQNGSYSGSGTTINDLLSPQTNLTVGNGHWVASSPNYWDLQGDTNLFSDNLAVAFESTTFTINCWYYPDFTSPEQYTAVWSFGNFYNPGEPVLSVNNTGSINIQWNFGYGIVSTTVTNEWHLFTFVSNGSTTTLYVDGIFIGSNSSSSGIVFTPVVIRLGSASRGANPPVEFAEGKIGFWNYYDIALNSTEVLALYNATESSYAGPPPPPPPYAGLVGGRTFGQGFAG